MGTDNSGAFSNKYAVKKKWSLDAGLLAQMARLFEGDTVADLGAGIGRYVVGLRDSGVDAVGYDGIAGIEELSEGMVQRASLHEDMRTRDRTDWCLTLEVGEHIPAEYENYFLDNVAYFAKTGAVVSWATEGQRGHGHVNCLPVEYVEAKLAGRGLHRDEHETDRLRAGALMARTFKRKVLVVRRHVDYQEDG